MKRLFPALIVLLGAHSASAAVLDFEGFAAGTIIDDEYSSMGITISVQNIGGGPDLGVVFDTGNPTGGDDDLGAPFAPGPDNELGMLDPGNVLIIQERDNCDGLTCTVPDDEGTRAAGHIRIDFGGLVELSSIDFFDIEMAETGPGEENRITLFDANGMAMSLDFFTPDTGGDNRWDQVEFNVSGVSAVQINLGGSGAIDNIVFTPVPVPAAFMLFAGALAALGFTRRAG
ncbi:MAG: thrombospondin type 3 repeat:Cna B-type [Pseudomonadota bacterium]